MNKCKNCKWYRNHAIQNENKYYYGMCYNDKNNCVYEPAEDGMCSQEEVFVGENFGCIHWEVSE